MATGFVLAGGRSRRMGRDKALLPWNGGTLLDHALDRVRAACPRVGILSGAERRYEDRGVPVYADRVADAGPLGGIHAALSNLQEGPGLILGVDLPFVTVALLQRLLDLFPGHDAVVPLSPAGPEPLCAVYGPGCLPAVRRCVQAGNLKATAFWPRVKVLTAGEAELGDLGRLDALFRNVNTPADYERARLEAP